MGRLITHFSDFNYGHFFYGMPILPFLPSLYDLWLTIEDKSTSELKFLPPSVTLLIYSALPSPISSLSKEDFTPEAEAHPGNFGFHSAQVLLQNTLNHYIPLYYHTFNSWSPGTFSFETTEHQRTLLRLSSLSVNLSKLKHSFSFSVLLRVSWGHLFVSLGLDIFWYPKFAGWRLF